MVYTKSNRKIIYNPRRKRIAELRAAHSVSNFHNNYRIDEEQFFEMRREGITDFRRVWFIKSGTKCLPLYLTPYVDELNSLYKPGKPLDLIEASMSGLEAEGLNLKGSDLTLANLEGANLREADLSYCILHGTRLAHANLYGANLKGTRLADVNVKDLLCLEGLREDELPLDFGVFLRRHENQIDYTLEGYEKWANSRISLKDREEKCRNNSHAHRKRSK